MSVPLLGVESLMLDYGDRPILSGVDMGVGRGRWIAVLGANGSGKSTLLRSIAGHHVPRSGRITIDGVDLYANPDTAPLPGYASHGEDLPDFLTLRESLQIYAEAHGFAAIPAHSLELEGKLGLSPHANILVRNASLGTRQKLALVIALLRSPRLLILDEAFNGLDFASALTLRLHLRQLVREKGLTVLMATHALHLVALCCDEWLLLEDGRLAKRRPVASPSTADAITVLEQELVGACPVHSHM